MILGIIGNIAFYPPKICLFYHLTFFIIDIDERGRVIRIANLGNAMVLVIVKLHRTAVRQCNRL
ncbi:hypothetical protein D3C85_1000110 [compost metagenome]